MAKVTFIVGLPGSGKTYLAHKLIKISRQFRQTLLFDDMKSKDMTKAEEAVKAGKDLYIADPWLCYPDYLAKAKILVTDKWGASEVEVIYFENHPEACIRNAKHRADERNVEGFIRHATKHYVIPEGVIKCRVWDGTVQKDAACS